MPEESRTPAGDRPSSSRAATVSGSDDPQSTTGKRPGDPAISTGVSLEGWRRYARYWPWPRGRHGSGRGRGRRGMSAMEVAQFMARVPGPRRGLQAQRPRGRRRPQTVEEGITEAKEPGLIAFDHPSKPLRVEGNMTGSAEGKPRAGKTDAEIALAKRWLPLRYPVYPSTGKFEDFLKHNAESEMIRKLNKAGHDNTGFYCSGVIISCDEDGAETVRILTSSGVLYDDNDELHSPEQKVSVKLSNGRKYEGHVLYVNTHYNIAILEACVGSSMTALCFASMPQYGQRVIALGRDGINLFKRDGIISRWEQTALGRTHYMFPKSANGLPLISTGGPVIDEDGAMVGIITCHVPKAAMMSISIVQICLDMWKNYSCIARPQINMNLRTVQMLPIDKQDKVQGIYNIQSGFVIDGVEYDSTPEKVGIRKGDVIEIVDENCGSTLPELETYLLLHGLRFLRKMEGLSRPKELELKIRVHDLVEGSSTDTHLSIPVVYEVALP